MAFNTIRRATEEDEQRLAAAWKRFCRRYNGRNVSLEADLVGFINCTYEEDAQFLERRWNVAACRALRIRVDPKHTASIGYGYVGTCGW